MGSVILLMRWFAERIPIVLILSHLFYSLPPNRRWLFREYLFYIEEVLGLPSVKDPKKSLECYEHAVDCTAGSMKMWPDGAE